LKNFQKNRARVYEDCLIKKRMNKKIYYVDTCIWLNLINREGDESKGVPYWKIAEDFLNQIKNNLDIKIIVSDSVLKELSYSNCEQSSNNCSQLLISKCVDYYSNICHICYIS